MILPCFQRVRGTFEGTCTEVPIPAYEAMVMHSRIMSRILEILMKGVSTRNYKEILPEMEKRFMRIMGCRQLWRREAKLKGVAENETIDTNARVA